MFWLAHGENPAPASAVDLIAYYRIYSSCSLRLLALAIVNGTINKVGTNKISN